MTLAFEDDPMVQYVENTPDAKPPPSEYLERKVTEVTLASFLLTRVSLTVGHAVALVYM
jgi:hypothetical protein